VKPIRLELSGSGIHQSDEAVGMTEESIVPAKGLLPGDVLAQRFVIERLAGSGGMGAVYRAKDLHAGAPVAIKIMAAENEHARRFDREALVLADLAHPAIVRYIAHGAHRGVRFLAMEWLEGEDLSVRLERWPLGIEEALSFLRGVCEGLAVAHGRGIVHRDIKPSNLRARSRKRRP
jgi:serine/threonine protein kinase